jgi:uncharacterized membrane protein YccF (DUF307 family)
MSCLGNFLWIMFGGFILALGWAITGILWCVTVVGIPIGVQCFKFALLALAPFGREVSPGGGVGSTLLNILWLIFGGLELAAVSALLGVVLCVTVVGAPLGAQLFKLARLALAPFGATIS